MAKIDAAIERLFKESGLELVFESGSGAQVRTRDGVKPLIKQPLTVSQIVGVFQEIVPTDLRGGFPNEGVTSFPYASPSGPVTIRFDKEEDSVRAVLAPYGATIDDPLAPSPEE